ncbi:MAG: molecular chaperone HtpG [Vampirovibrio sp.]|nr:molecular chaperone HtpG [Vampirovibrio sp.]
MAATAEKHTFQAEVKELLDLMIHAIYSNKEIFLRELISNSSDALDKLKFEALTQPELKPSDWTPHILLSADKDARTLTIADNGIGMSKEDVVNLIGTIAKSGTAEFAAALKAQAAQNEKGEVSPDLIGQFGVGFYSTFMVADNVTLITRKAGEETATQWQSTGDGNYTIEEATRDACGTSITLHLKPEDADNAMLDYADRWVLQDIVKKYSDFVIHPVQMDVEITEVERDEEGKPVEGGKETTRIERQTLNSMKAIWTRPESEVTPEEYNEFYKHIAHDWTDPLETIRMKMEGTFEAQSLLFIPTKAPFDLFFKDFQHGIHLYVKRVFIMNDCKELMPRYLRFIRGVVDSEDLSLNISREILQQDRQIRAIRKRLVKKVLSTLDNLKKGDTDNKGKYKTFWDAFGQVLKEGLFEDQENTEALLDVCLFHSSKSETEQTDLREYISRMQSGQEEIYYMTGESYQAVINSPHLEAFQAKGVEVLVLTDPVDEIWIQSVPEFDGKRLRSVGKGLVDLGTDEEKKAAEAAREEKQESHKSLLEALQAKLDTDIKEVRLSSRLTDSAACLVGDTHDMTPQMEKLMKAMNQEAPKTKRILELNPDHPILEKLNGAFSQNKEDTRIEDYAHLLYNQALLAEGSPIPDPAKFSKLLSDLMVQTL